MLFTLKTSITISVICIVSLIFASRLTHLQLKKVYKLAIYTTIISFAFLAISKIYLSFFLLVCTFAIAGKNDKIASGLVIFGFVTLPVIPITLMAGSLQLIDIGTETCVTLGILISSLWWTKGFSNYSFSRDLPAYAIIAVMTFMGARDTAVTNVARLLLENALAFLVPYLLTKKFHKRQK